MDGTASASRGRWKRWEGRGPGGSRDGSGEALEATGSWQPSDLTGEHRAGQCYHPGVTVRLQGDTPTTVSQTHGKAEAWRVREGRILPSVSVSPSYCNKMQDWESEKQPCGISHGPGGSDQGPGRLSLWWLSLACDCHLLTVSEHGGRSEAALWGLFYEGSNPLRKVSSFMT